MSKPQQKLSQPQDWVSQDNFAYGQRKVAKNNNDNINATQYSAQAQASITAQDQQKPRTKSKRKSRNKSSSFNFPQSYDQEDSRIISPNPHSNILKQSLISNFQHDRYSTMNSSPKLHIIFYEALAAFIFLFGCSCIGNGHEDYLSPQYAVYLLFAICMSGSLSGSNVNPSVTLSNYFRKENKYELRIIPLYLIGQLLGSCLALLASKYINEISFVPVIPDNHHDWFEITRQILSVAMGTFILVFFLLEITNPNTTFIQNEISGFLSIVLFFFLAMGLCPVKGAFVKTNLIIIVSVNLMATLFQNNHQGWQQIWIYLLGSIIGVGVAVVFYDKGFQPIINRLREARRNSFEFSQFTADQEQEGDGHHEASDD